MHTRLIPVDRWRATLDDVSRTYDDVLVSLEIVGGSIGAEEEVCDQPLRGLSSDRSGVMVQIERAGGLHLDHRIAQPQKLRIVESDEGVLIAVEIEDSGGVHNFVRFASAPGAEIVDRAVE